MTPTVVPLDGTPFVASGDPSAWVLAHDAGVELDLDAVSAVLATVDDAIEVVTFAWLAEVGGGIVARQGVASLERLRWRNSVGPTIAVRAGALERVESDELGNVHGLSLRLLELGAVAARTDVIVGRRSSVGVDHPDLLVDAVIRHLGRSGIDADVRPGLTDGEVHTVVERSAPPVPVALIVPTSGRPAAPGEEPMIERMLDSMAVTDYPPELIEIVVVIGPEAAPGTAARLRDRDRRVRVVDDAAPFTHSRRTNVGALHAGAEMLVLMNDDTEVISPGWLAQIVATASEPDVGLVGPLLLYDDDTVQSAGHAHPPVNIGSPRCPVPDSQRFELRLGRDVSGVTLACAAVRRDVFDAVGGLTQRIHNALNDVDFAMKCASLGLRHVSLGHVAIRHLETKTRISGVHRFEMAVLAERWGTAVVHEPYFVADRSAGQR